MQNHEQYLTEVEVSTMTRIALLTLRNARSRGMGIAYYKVSRSIRYRLSDILDFMETKRITTSSVEMVYGD